MEIRLLQSKINFKASKMQKKEAEYINRNLLSGKSVDIFCHVATDEDSFNSARIMYDYLVNQGKDVRIICNNAQDNYGFNTKKYNAVEYSDDLKKADKALCLDFSEPVRLRSNTLKYLKSYKPNDIFCIDHHDSAELITDSIINENSEEIAVPKNGYIDVNAKSTASVLTRFFEALNIKMTDNQKAAAYCGMTDDMLKSGFLELSDSKLQKTENFYNNKKVKEVYEKIESNLNEDKQKEIIQHLDILSKLNPQEENFRKNLFKKIRFTNNNEFAYVVIPPDDKDWKNIGGDNFITSNILRDFRIRIMKNDSEDNFIDKDLSKKLSRIKSIAVFYPDYKRERYRISIHSKEDYAFRLIEYNKQNYNPELIAGGHKNRSGGSMPGLDKKQCNLWVENFVKSAENI